MAPVRMARNNTPGQTVRCTCAASSEAYALVSATPPGTTIAKPKIIIQPVRKPAVRPSPRLL